MTTDTALDSTTDGATLLVVDDDIRIRTLLASGLAAHGFKVLTAADAADMKRQLAQRKVDVVILDVMMPGEDGLSACRRLERDGGPPVILLSALGEETDRILGLESGADHYLSKPCSTREVLAHVRTVLRRQRKTGESTRRLSYFLGYRLDLDTHELFNPEGVLVDLSEGEFGVLRVFVERPRRVLSRAELLLASRGADSEAFDRAIDIQVSRLRRKLRDRDATIIRTVRNEGYMFVPRVSVEPS